MFQLAYVTETNRGSIIVLEKKKISGIFKQLVIGLGWLIPYHSQFREWTAAQSSFCGSLLDFQACYLLHTCFEFFTKIKSYGVILFLLLKQLSRIHSG